MEPQYPNLRLLRLLVALDALLAEGSVGAAAKRLGLSAAATSRLLAQIRDTIQDPVFIRAGRKLVPTPRAEALRRRVGGLVSEAQALLAPEACEPDDRPPGEGWIGDGAVRPAALRVRDSLLAGPADEPAASPALLALAADDARLRMAGHLRAIARSHGQSRPLTAEEAEDAFGMVLRGEADPMQVGGMLLVMNYRNETAPELTGLVRAARRHAGAWAVPSGAVDLDWPAYISPHARKPPWFLQSAALVARAGHRVLVHGHSGSGEMRAKLEVAARALGIAVCTSFDAAAQAVARSSIAYLPLGAISAQLCGLIGLHRLFEARSPVNSLVHLLNPLGAPAVLVGSVRAGYRELHRDAAALLGWPRLLALGSGRDVAELMPFKPAPVFGLERAASGRLTLPWHPAPPAVKATGLTTLEYWMSVWDGTTREPRARDIILATTALGLLAITGGDEATFQSHRRAAEELWEERHAARPQLAPPEGRRASDPAGAGAP